MSAFDVVARPEVAASGLFMCGQYRFGSNLQRALVVVDRLIALSTGHVVKQETEPRRIPPGTAMKTSLNRVAHLPVRRQKPP